MFQEDHEECDEGVEGPQDNNPFSFNSTLKMRVAAMLETILRRWGIDTGEVCDDRNGMNGDGCSELCVVEPGMRG